MMDVPPDASPIPEIVQPTLFELWTCLAAGLRDFRRAPLVGLVFSGFYVAVGFVLL